VNFLLFQAIFSATIKSTAECISDRALNKHYYYYYYYHRRRYFMAGSAERFQRGIQFYGDCQWRRHAVTRAPAETQTEWHYLYDIASVVCFNAPLNASINLQTSKSYFGLDALIRGQHISHNGRRLRKRNRSTLGLLPCYYSVVRQIVYVLRGPEY